MTTKRQGKRLVAAGICAALLMTASAAQAVTEWKFAHKMPTESPDGKVFQFFADKVKEYSDGELVIQVYPSEQLGKEASILEQLELGTVQIFADEGFFLQKWVPEMKWVEPPFLFENREQWAKFVNSDLVHGWLQKVEDEAGIRALGDPSAMVRGPYRVVVSKSPVKVPKDIVGLSLRMYPDELAISVWSHLGADLQMLSWTEIYEGLKSGVVDSLTAPMAQVESMKFYEVAPYITRTNEFWPSPLYAMNAAAFDDLSQAEQNALLRAHQDMAAYSKELMETTVKEQVADLEKKGVTFVDMDTAPLFKEMAAWYAQQEEKGQLPEGFLKAAQAARQ